LVFLTQFPCHEFWQVFFFFAEQHFQQVYHLLVTQRTDPRARRLPETLAKEKLIKYGTVDDVVVIPVIVAVSPDGYVATLHGDLSQPGDAGLKPFSQGVPGGVWP